MCGRYTLRTPVEALAEQFGLSGEPEPIYERFNVAPMSEVPAIIEEDGSRSLQRLRWGLVPSWADDPGIGARMINARSETAPEKPSFRKAFRERRCLLPADGFYEWQRTDDGKQPYHFRMKDGRPFAFAGLWEVWKDGNGGLRTCTILTTAPNETVAQVHNRMPVILSPEDYDLWLDPEMRDTEYLTPLLRPYDADQMEAFPVSRFVNRPTNDDERCVERVA
jgi:putative SOS response-associated peptidase YedK